MIQVTLPIWMPMLFFSTWSGMGDGQVMTVILTCLFWSPVVILQAKNFLGSLLKLFSFHKELSFYRLSLQLLIVLWQLSFSRQANASWNC